MDSINYPCGTLARLGDIVNVDGMTSTVEDIIVTTQKQQSWDLDEPGIMLKNIQMGLFFEPFQSQTWQATTFLARAENNSLE